MKPPTPVRPLAWATPVPTPADVPLDVIFIDGLVAETVIGIDTGELHAPQPLRIDVQAGVARARACDTDRIGDTIHYGALRTRLLALLAQHRVQLLEALAEQIADIVLHEFRAQWTRVRVAKPRKFDDVDAVGVVIERRRATALQAVDGGADAAADRRGDVGGGASRA